MLPDNFLFELVITATTTIMRIMHRLPSTMMMISGNLNSVDSDEEFCLASDGLEVAQLAVET